MVEPNEYNIEYELPIKEEQLTDEEVLRLKIRQILCEWYFHGQELRTEDFTIERAESGYKVSVITWKMGKPHYDHNQVSDIFFVSNKLIDRTRMVGGSVVVGCPLDYNEYKEVVRKWDLVAVRWNELTMARNEVATKLTYQRYFALDNLQVRKLV